MKNHLFKVCFEDRTDADYGHVKKTWRKLHRTLLRSDANPIFFFRYYLMATSEPGVTGQVTKTKLYDHFRRVLSEVQASENLTVDEFVDDISAQVDNYLAIMNADVEKFNQRQNRILNTKLRHQKALNFRKSRIVILRALQDVESSSDFLRLLELLEVWTVRRKINDEHTGSGTDKTCSSICDNAFDSGDLIKNVKRRLENVTPRDKVFKQALQQRDFKDNSFARYILWRIETEHYRVTDVKEMGNQYERVDLEHIAPRKSFSAKKYTKWQDYLNMGEEQFEQLKSKIGNLTLLEKSPNQAASNKPFQQKKAFYTDSQFQLTRAVTDRETWGENEIRERRERLANIAVNIWDLDTV